jgi:hypothetical protein
MHMQLVVDRTMETVAPEGVVCQRWEGAGPNGGRFELYVRSLIPLDGRALDYVASCADACLSPAEPTGRTVPATVSLSGDELRAYVARWIVDTWGTIHDNRTQAALMRLVKTAHEDGEDAVALSLVLLMEARSARLDGEALSALSLALGDLGVELPTEDAAGNAGRPEGN